MNWEKYIGYEVNVIMKEYYGVVQTDTMKEPFYEIVFKAGTLNGVYEDGLLLLAKFQNRVIESFIPFESIKCVDIIHPQKES